MCITTTNKDDHIRMQLIDLDLEIGDRGEVLMWEVEDAATCGVNMDMTG